MIERLLRHQALQIFKAGLKAADPEQAVLRHVHIRGNILVAEKQRYRLNDIRHIYVVGAGKAGGAMGRAIERLLGTRISRGFINVKYDYTAKLRRIELNECGHPVPDLKGVQGAEQIAAIVDQAGEADLVICLISGGASALMPSPAPPVTLEQKQETTRLLLASGASIHEINAVRKHISLLKGGQLAQRCYPATVLSLLLSDVIGDDLDVIGSGPTAPDLSTFGTAKAVLQKYHLEDKVPHTVIERIERGIAGDIPETPKPADECFRRTQNLIVGSNNLAVTAAAAKARALGLRPMVLSTFIEGETKDVARVHAAIAKEMISHGRPLEPPACLISGGETTVTLRGAGLGGRNQEFALAAAIDLAGLEDVVVLSGGTDGTDGPTDATGAIADGRTVSRAAGLGMAPAFYLTEHDSYHFFEPLGDLLKTGPTNTNVMDIHLLLIGARRRNRSRN